VRAWRLGLGAAGLAAVAYGGWGVLTGGVATSWRATLAWGVAAALLHDLLLVGLVAAAGWLVGRLVPARVRPVVQGGLLVAGVLTLVALPVVTGRGDPTNPSTTPLDYPRNLVLVLLAVAAVTAVLAARRWRARRVSRRPAAG
jgi:hypothetical protein